MNGRMKKPLLFCLLALLAALPFFAAFAEGIDVYFLDVGQGSCAFIECDGCTMLIDGGPKTASQYVYSFLKNHDVGRLDYLVATHSDLDHVGGIAAALNAAQAGIVFAREPEPPFADIQKNLDVQKNHILVPTEGDRFSLGEASVTVIGPRRGAVYSDNTSLVLRVEYGATSFLFVGDSEMPDERALMDSKQVLKSTVLCVGHHGSSSSSSERFLKAVAPRYAVISVGADNSYGHPDADVLKRLSRLGVTTYRTDLDGQIRISSDGKNVSIVTEGSGDFISTGDFASGSAAADGAGTRAYASKPVESGPTPAPESHEISEDVRYVGNAKTKKFHYPDCDAVSDMKMGNAVCFYGDREEPLADGYVPCKRCDP